MHHSSVGGGGKSGFEERGPHLKGTRAVFAVVAQRKPAADRADGLEASGSPRAVCSFRPGSFLHAALPAWVLHATRRVSGLGPLLHAPFPAWVLHATRRVSRLGPPCYAPLFRPGSSLLHAAFPAWVWSGSSLLHAVLPVWV